MATALMLLRHAGRRLRRSPAFAGAAVLTLALAIGATTTVYSLIDAVLLRPLPYAQPERLVDLTHGVSLSGATSVDQSDATFLYYRRESRAFVDIAAYRDTPLQLGALAGAAGDADRPERVSGARVSASTFGVLGVRPLLGRAIRKPTIASTRRRSCCSASDSGASATEAIARSSASGSRSTGSHAKSSA